jgi:predicted membrane protein
MASAAFLEIVLLILFHKSLMSFIIILMIIYALLFFAMLTITIIQPRHAEKEKKEFQELKKWWGKRYKRIKR